MEEFDIDKVGGEEIVYDSYIENRNERVVVRRHGSRDNANSSGVTPSLQSPSSRNTSNVSFRFHK